MSEFGWTRLAYLTVILAAVAILVKLGAFGIDSIPEDFPESALAFAQRGPVSEEDLDWGNRKNRTADERPEAKTAVSRETRGETRGDERGDERDEEDDQSREPVESVYENVNFKEDPPVFYRPAPRAALRVGGASTEPSPGAKSCRTLSDAPSGSKILFPLAREYFDSYDDTWGAARPQGGHEGADMMAPMGTPEYAVTDGTVVPVSGSNSNGWNTLGGYAVMIEAAYTVGPVKKGDLFYYAHMDRRSDLQIGDTVKAGDIVGYAGDTGEGPEGTRGKFPSHLHLGWYETSGERTQLASGAMNPYPLLEWIKANGGSIEGGSDIPYCEAPQPATPTPSGGGYWQFPTDPGVRPDMSTETDTAVPSPIVEQNASSEFSPDVSREQRRPDRPAEPNRPENPQPPEEMEEPPEPAEPPRNGAPAFPNLPNPLPGIGGIGGWIGGIFDPERPEPGNQRPPKNDNETAEPTRPVPPPEETENENPEQTTPETTNPEDDGCEPRKRAGREKNKESRPDEGCREETTPKDPPPEETTPEEDTSIEETILDETDDGPATDQYEPEAAEDQYEGGESEARTQAPERPKASPGA